MTYLHTIIRAFISETAKNKLEFRYNNIDVKEQLFYFETKFIT